MALRKALLLGVLLAEPSAATSDKTPAPPVFSSEVSLVSIPVFVTDRNGQASRGLLVEDFELYEDGKRMPIASFQYVDNTTEDQQELIREAPAARRRFLFLFDLSFTDLGGLHRAQESARTFLRTKLAPSDLAAVLTFDTNRGVRVVANFTEDRSLLSHAVETLGAPTLARIQDPLNLTFGATDIQGGGARRAVRMNRSVPLPTPTFRPWPCVSRRPTRTCTSSR